MIVLLAMSPLHGLVLCGETKSKDKRPNGIERCAHPRAPTAMIVDVMTWPSAGATRSSSTRSDWTKVRAWRWGCGEQQRFWWSS